MDVDVAHLGRSGRGSGKHLGCDRLGLGSGRRRNGSARVDEERPVEEMLGDVVEALSSTMVAHAHTGTHTKETGEGEESKEGRVGWSRTD